MKKRYLVAAALALQASSSMGATAPDFRRMAANMIAFEANRGQAGAVTPAITRDANEFLTYVQGALEAYDLQGLVCTPPGVSVGVAATKIAREIVSNERTKDQSPAVQVYLAATFIYSCRSEAK